MGRRLLTTNIGQELELLPITDEGNMGGISHPY